MKPDAEAQTIVDAIDGCHLMAVIGEDVLTACILYMSRESGADRM